MLCSICFNELPAVGTWTEGNNAEPVNMGRCCNNCDNSVVIPARINSMMRGVPHHTYMAMLREQFDAMRRVIEAYDLRQAEAQTATSAAS